MSPYPTSLITSTSPPPVPAIQLDLFGSSNVRWPFPPCERSSRPFCEVVIERTSDGRIYYHCLVCDRIAPGITATSSRY
jgi:hypothetical protein